MRSPRRSPHGAAPHAAAPIAARRRGRLRGDGGYILIEMLIAAAILVVGLVGLLALLDATVKTTAATRAREGASNLARQVLEDARTISYAQISPGSITAELQAMPGLADASATPGWQVVQRGITYTVTASDCSIDDPKDGYGNHEPTPGFNPYCSDSGTTGAADTQPEDLKRISVDVKWTALGRNPVVHQVETLSAAGVSPGLAASNLKLTSPVVPESEQTAPKITSAATKSLSFGVTAPSSTVAMRWSLEGVAQTTAPTKASETSWTFSWAIPLPGEAGEVADGTYTVSVQAIDATGVLGPPVSIPVTLIRVEPAAVTGLKGGFSHVYEGGVRKPVVELEWTANKERNVSGYHVWEPTIPSVVCPPQPQPTTISCIDLSPPSESSPSLLFKAKAMYTNASGVTTESLNTGSIPIAKAPGEPGAPTALECGPKNADGSLTLKWKAGTGSPSFYRIYRGNFNYTDRYDVTAGSTPTYTDSDAAVAHTYWVTAVGTVANPLAESPISTNSCTG